MTYSKNTSRIELLRKPISRLFVAVIIPLALFTTPKNTGEIVGEIMEMLGFALLILAAIGRIWCSIYIAGKKDKVLCVDGPYSLCRNPLYFFSFVGVLGGSLALQSLSIMLICSVAYLVFYRFIIRSEEGRLQHIFGEQYAAYCASVPRFIPHLKHPRNVESLSINPRILESGLKEVVWFLLAIIAIETLGLIHDQGLLVFAHTPI